MIYHETIDSVGLIEVTKQQLAELRAENEKLRAENEPLKHGLKVSIECSDKMKQYWDQATNQVNELRSVVEEMFGDLEMCADLLENELIDFEKYELKEDKDILRKLKKTLTSVSARLEKINKGEVK